MTSATPPADPVAIIRALDAEAIAQRLADLDAEQRALRVLLRTARAHEQAGGRHPARKRKAVREVAHA